MLIGFLYAGSGIAKAFLPETDLEIEPSFEEEQMDADLAFAISHVVSTGTKLAEIGSSTGKLSLLLIYRWIVHTRLCEPPASMQTRLANTTMPLLAYIA